VAWGHLSFGSWVLSARSSAFVIDLHTTLLRENIYLAALDTTFSLPNLNICLRVNHCRNAGGKECDGSDAALLLKFRRELGLNRHTI